MRNRWVITLLLCVIFVTAAKADTELFEIREVGNDRGSYIALVTAAETVVFPKKLALKSSEGQRAVSAIVQKGDAFDAEVPYFVNFTLNYSFVTDPVVLAEVIKSEKIDPKTMKLAQSMKYTSTVAVWSPNDGKYILKALDAGSTSFASNLVGTFSLDFKNAQEISNFFKHPHPLIIVVEAHPDINLVITRDNSTLNRLLDTFLEGEPLPTTLPLTSLYLKLVSTYGKRIPGDEAFVVSELARKLAAATIEIGTDGRPRFVLPAAGSGGTNSPGPERLTISLPDRTVSTLDIPICGDDSQIVLIDIGKEGCTSLNEMLEVQ